MGHEGRVFLPHKDRHPGRCSHSRSGDVVMFFEVQRSMFLEVQGSGSFRRLG